MIPNRREHNRAMESENPREALDDLYRNKYGWVEEAVWEFVTFNPNLNTALLKTYRIQAERLGCSCGCEGKANVIKREKSGVYKTCRASRVTSGAFSFDNFEEIDSQMLGVQDAIVKCRELNMIVPHVLKQLTRRKKSPVMVYR
jgi:hypothetical protein